MKRFLAFLMSMLLVIMVGCGKVEEGTLYTKDNIFIDFIKMSYPEAFTTKTSIMEDDKALENATIRFKTTRKKKKDDTSGVMAGDITYAVFSKEELAECDFSEQSYVLYPGK